MLKHVTAILQWLGENVLNMYWTLIHCLRDRSIEESLAFHCGSLPDNNRQQSTQPGPERDVKQLTKAVLLHRLTYLPLLPSLRSCQGQRRHATGPNNTGWKARTLDDLWWPQKHQSHEPVRLALSRSNISRLHHLSSMGRKEFQYEVRWGQSISLHTRMCCMFHCPCHFTNAGCSIHW
jgi:hypothetical protein